MKKTKTTYIYFSGKLNLWLKRLGYRQIFVTHNPQYGYGFIRGICFRNKQKILTSPISFFTKSNDMFLEALSLGFLPQLDFQKLSITKENLTDVFLKQFGGLYMENIKTGTYEKVPADIIELEIAVL